MALFPADLKAGGPVSYHRDQKDTSLNIEGARTDDFLLVVPPDGDDKTARLTRLFHRLHDSLYTRWTGSQAGGDVNKMSNYDVVRDILSEENHIDKVAPYGDAGVGKLQGQSFFSTNISVLRGMLGRQPLVWSLNSVSPEIAIKKIEKVARQGAEGAMRELARRLKEGGLNMDSALIDPSVYVPSTPQEVEKGLTDKDALEIMLHDLLTASLLHDKTKQKLDDSFEDRCIINGQIVEVYAEGGWPRTKVWRRDQVSWWGPDELEDADQADVWDMFQMLPLHQAVTKYGGQMAKVGTYAQFLETMKKVSQGRPTFTAYKDGTLQKPLHDNQPSQDMMGNPVGIYGRYYQSGQMPMVLESKVSAKLIAFTPVKITLAGRPFSEQQREDYDAGIMPESDAVLFEKVDQKEYDAEKGNPAYKNVSRVERYESVRLGDQYMIYHRPAAIQFRKKHDPVNVSHNIVASFGRDTSLVTKGLPLHELYVNVMMEMRKLVALSGMKAIHYDLSQMPDGWDIQRVMYEAKESGILVFNGKAIGGAPSQGSYKHMQSVDLSLVGDAVALLNLATGIRALYDELCGVTAGLKGQFQSRESLGQTQMSSAAGSVMTQKLFAHHEGITEAVMNKMLMMGQRLWSRNEKRSVILGENHAKTLQLSEEIGLYDFGLFVTSTSKNAEDRAFIIQVADKALSSGAIGFADLIKLAKSDNPFKTIELIENGLGVFEKMKAQAGQMQAEASQVAADAAMKRATSSVDAADVTGRWKMEIERARQYFEAERQDRDVQFKEEKSDIDATNQLLNQAAQQEGQQNLVGLQAQTAAADPQQGQAGQMPMTMGA